MGFRTLPDGRVVYIENAKPTASAPARPLITRPTQYDGFKSYSAFTAPNYVCRTCGQKVFYYEHPNGAKVLFDQLGPPWPKHPCYESASHNNIKAKRAQPKLKKSQWRPMLFNQAVRLTSGGLRVLATFEGGTLRFELSAAQVKLLAIDEKTVNESLILGMVTPLKAQAEVAVSSGLKQTSVFTNFVVLNTPPPSIPTSKDNNAALTTEPQMNTVGVPARPDKAALVKHVNEPTVKVVNRRLQLQRLSLSMKTEHYFVVIGYSGKTLYTLGLPLKVPKNLDVLKHLATNPKSLVLSPYRRGSEDYKVVLKGKKLGKLESKIKTEHEVKIPKPEEHKEIVDSPFRNPVISQGLSDELKAYLAKGSKQAD
ncbi:hypothetical protein [Providencia rettgeri]|uniref:hypothetical protein n=1 Tax=Providencia rettgeri TaxID=587 RepID=UPI00205D7340|nr:hypothetical protein [Providencia rettgeri]UPS63001.1 hypothetical protein M0M83_00150 [Providencia rettgeri]